MDQPALQYVSISSSVYLWIKNAIINGELEGGQRLIQEELTEKLGVSRTPVRDAIRRLESEGLVINKPFYGAVVFQPSISQLKEIYEVRILLEQYCVERACHIASDEEILKIKAINDKMAKMSSDSREYMQLDCQFHEQICQLAKDAEITLEILENLWTRCSSFKSLYFSLHECADSTIDKHYRVVDRMMARDVEGSKAAIAEHLNDVVKTIGKALHLENGLS